jgi:hypothetical protein
MSGARLRSAAIALAAVLAHGCVVAPGEVGVEAAAPGYGVDYYDPPIAYGGWGVGYEVAPYRRGDREHRREFRGGEGRDDRGGGRGFRPAPAGRPVPTIPTGARGGGGPRGGGDGGGHGGGGRR